MTAAMKRARAAAGTTTLRLDLSRPGIEDCELVSLSVPLRSVGGMPERRVGRPSGGVWSLGLHLVWCATCRRRVPGGRVAHRLRLTAPCGAGIRPPAWRELLEQVTAERGW
jgi:hypothetical protein